MGSTLGRLHDLDLSQSGFKGRERQDNGVVASEMSARTPLKDYGHISQVRQLTSRSVVVTHVESMGLPEASDMSYCIDAAGAT